ncbi:hypothetical protein JNUCC0626_37595 [Lentzea sp. JNUCC 0626]|uniref:hypothetical protein n=1 Tax=Lentzea sp. JNUCC 0626 TaxID=3367513 RepID=UPI003747E58F
MRCGRDPRGPGHTSRSEPGCEPWIKAVRIEDVLLSFDEHSASVRVRWFRCDDVLVDLYDEGATRMPVRSGAGESHVVVEYADGEMAVRIHPSVRIKSRHH